MPNLYGVANAPVIIQQIQPMPVGTTACPAGVWTVLATSLPIIAPSQGWFYILCAASIDVMSGATAASGINLGVSIGAGSVVGAQGLSSFALVANTSLIWSPVIYSSATQTPWMGAGSTVSIQFQPTGQAVQIQGAGTALVMLVRAPDQ